MDTYFFPSLPELSEFYSGILILEGDIENEFESLMSVKGMASLGIPFGEPFYYRLAEPSLVKNKLPTEFLDEPLLFGQITTFGKIVIRGRIRLAIVVFTPLGICPFLRDNVWKYTNLLTPISQIPTVEFPQDLFIALKICRNHIELVELIGEYLQSRFAGVPKKFQSGNLNKVVDKIYQTNGQVTVPELAANVNTSKRSLEMSFKMKVGLSPKVYCRITRFCSVYNKLADAFERDFFELILEYGYADQSHFIKDFVEFTGFTPKKHLKSPFWLDIKINRFLSEDKLGIYI